MKKIFTLLVAALAMTAANAQDVTVDFEDINLAENSFDNGSNAGGKFTSGGFNFVNNYNAAWQSFSGFTISTQTSTAYTGNLAEQFNSCVGSGADGSKTYSVCYYSIYDAPITITNAAGKTFTPKTVALTNNAWAFTSMRTGDSYAKKFTESDNFKLTFIGKKGGQQTATVEVSLAEAGMILFTWKTIDLSALGEVDEIDFSMSSTDTGAYGINTPTYFCIDNFKATVNESSAVKSVSVVSDAKATAFFTMDGKQLPAPQKGVNIIKMSDGSTRKIIIL